MAAIYGRGIARDSTHSLTFEFLFYDLTFAHDCFLPKICLALDRTIQRNRSRLLTARRGRLFAATAYSPMTLGLIGGLILGMPGRYPVRGQAGSPATERPARTPLRPPGALSRKRPPAAARSSIG